MIGSLRGTLFEVSPPGEASLEVVLDVGGVGYRVTLEPSRRDELPPLGEALSLSVHTHVREGAITLYGFQNADERRCFETLILAHGVGPSLALSILSRYDPATLATIVALSDVDALCLVPGVGKKTAQRLVIELAQRLEPPMSAPSAGGRAPDPVRSEVKEALTTLGYAPEEVRKVVDELPEEASVETLLREALRALAPRP